MAIIGVKNCYLQSGDGDALSVGKVNSLSVSWGRETLSPLHGAKQVIKSASISIVSCGGAGDIYNLLGHLRWTTVELIDGDRQLWVNELPNTILWEPDHSATTKQEGVDMATYSINGLSLQCNGLRRAKAISEADALVKCKGGWSDG